MASKVDDGAGPQLPGPFISLWERVVDGSGNIAYRLGLNSLNRALDAHPELGQRLAPRDPEGLRALGKGIASGDPDAAAGAARRLLEPDIDLAG